MMEKKQDLLSSAVCQSVSESLENMVFMAVKPSRMIWSKVQVTAPVTGSLTVAFPEKLVDQFVGELHAGQMDEAQHHAVLMDTVAEMANTIAGRMMNMLVPENEEFEIGLPKTGTGDIDYKFEAAYIQHFEIDEMMYVVVVEGKGLLDYRDRAATMAHFGGASAEWGS